MADRYRDYDRERTERERWERDRESGGEPGRYGAPQFDRGDRDRDYPGESSGWIGNQGMWDSRRHEQNRGWAQNNESERDPRRQQPTGQSGEREWSERMTQTFTDYDRENRENQGRFDRGDYSRDAAAGGSNSSAGSWGAGMLSGQSGKFAGRGPRTYQRNDDRIMEDVCETLTRHPDIDASNMEIRVESGVVTLSGTVDDRNARRMAEDVVCDVWGVRDVNNQIRVQRASEEQSPWRK